MNAQRPTFNGQRSENGAGARVYDLEERLLEFAAGIVHLTEQLPQTRAGHHVAGQLLRSGTSPLPDHGEAQAAESRGDFIHKMSICLKEPRETRRWLMLVSRVPMAKQQSEVEKLTAETEELIRLFASSLKTARSRKLERSKLGVER